MKSTNCSFDDLLSKKKIYNENEINIINYCNKINDIQVINKRSQFYLNLDNSLFNKSKYFILSVLIISYINRYCCSIYNNYCKLFEKIELFKKTCIDNNFYFEFKKILQDEKFIKYFWSIYFSENSLIYQYYKEPIYYYKDNDNEIDEIIVFKENEINEKEFNLQKIDINYKKLFF